MNAPQKDLQQAKRTALEQLLSPNKPPGNVVGVGIGKKYTDGLPTSTDCIRVYVVSKFKPDLVRPFELVPPDFDGVPSDVIAINRLGRKGSRKPPAKPPANPQPGSPIRIKTDAPNVNSGAIGTLGMVVVGPDNRYILGCNHILAVNGRVLDSPQAEIAWAEFVGQNESIAIPDVYVPFTRTSDNPVDCALAKITEPGKVLATFPTGFVKVSSGDPILPLRDMHVKKVGAATQITEGNIVDISADLYVDYSFGRFRFANQILIDSGADEDEFATAGDSGSIIVETETRHAVAMVFAASGRFAVACPLTKVLEELQTRLGNGKGGGPTLKLLTS